MPLYRYTCKNCGKEVVLLRESTKRDEGPVCECGGTMERVYSPSVAIEIRTVTGFSKISLSGSSEPIYIRRHRNWTPPEDFLRKKMPPKIL